MKENNKKYLTLDGSPKVRRKIMQEFLDSFTTDEIERAMSDEFAYLDEE